MLVRAYEWRGCLTGVHPVDELVERARSGDALAAVSSRRRSGRDGAAGRSTIASMLPDVVPLDEMPEGAQAVVQAIYEEAFPVRQRVPFEELVEGARSGDELALVGLENGRPIGLAFLSRLESARHLFLEYFAVASDLRGAGHGASLWTALRQQLAARELGLPIVLEVEDPAEKQIDAAEAAHRARRVRFWEKAGAIVLPVDGYVIPDVGGDGSEPMRLMWMPGRPDDEHPRDERLLKLILALYEAGYGLDHDDVLVQRALRLWS